MTDKQPEALIRADELEAIGAESSLARTMAAHTIRLLYKENEALRAALAQPEQEKLGEIVPADEEQLKRIAKLVEPEQEPVPKRSKGALSHEENKQHNKMILDKFYEENAHLYTAPPQREWQGLTDEEYEAIREDGQFGKGSIRFKNLFEAIEACLREKNS